MVQNTQMSESPKVMTAGEISRRSRLSPKALRVYDERDLLSPFDVDPANGYRYYHPSQLAPARLIGLLRRLDMPLDQIAVILEMEPAVAVKEIGAYWGNVESDIQSKRKLVRYIDNYLLGTGTNMFHVSTRETTSQDVATIQEHHFVATLSSFIDRAMSTIYDQLARAGLETGVPFVVYHGQVNSDSDGPVEVCVPYVGTFQPVDVVATRIEEGGPQAFTTITKSQLEFPGILEAYDAVASWVETNHVDFKGDPREIYFADPSQLEDDDPVADIAWPVR